MNKVSFTFTFLMLLVLTSCEKPIANEIGEIPSVVPENAAKLSVVTRGSGDDDSPIKQGCIYIFNQEGNCINLLTTNEESNAASAQLASGSYSLYAIGGNDLTRFNLPTQSEATPTSIITRKEGKAMDDLLMKEIDISATEGEEINKTILLDHKVLCLDKIEIQNISSEATKVEVSISPFYSSMKLDGTFPESPTESFKIALTKQSDNKTWSANPNQMLFPSKGTPTVKISITTGTEKKDYSYTTAELLASNHHFDIAGIYMPSNGFTLTGVLTSTAWGDDKSITFSFDDNGNTENVPIAGNYYNGYYVISTDRQARTAILLAKKSVTYTAPSNETNASLWEEAFVEPLSALAKPDNSNSNSWRLPTSAEAEIFLGDKQTVSYYNGSTSAYFCKDQGVLSWACMKENNQSYTFKISSKKFNNMVLLRPVIEITF